MVAALLLIAAASVLGPLRAGAGLKPTVALNESNRGIVQDLLGCEDHGPCHGYGHGCLLVYLGRSFADRDVDFAFVRVHVLYDNDYAHHSTLAQPARGTERSEYRTRQPLGGDK